MFSLPDKLERVQFFEKIFLLADISMYMVLEMPFLFFSNADIEFAELAKLIWRFYNTAETLLITSQVELIDKKEFVKAALDKNSEIFAVYIAIPETTKTISISIHLLQVAKIAVLLWDKTPTEVPAKYFDYADVFSFDLTMKLSENTDINKYTIKLIKGKQPSYRPIHGLSPVEWEILKTYIETHLKIEFI